MCCARWRSRSVASGDCCPLAFCCWGTLLPRSLRCRPSSSPVPPLPKNKQPSASVISPLLPFLLVPLPTPSFRWPGGGGRAGQDHGSTWLWASNGKMSSPGSATYELRGHGKSLRASVSSSVKGSQERLLHGVIVRLLF